MVKWEIYFWFLFNRLECKNNPFNFNLNWSMLIELDSLKALYIPWASSIYFWKHSWALNEPNFSLYAQKKPVNFTYQKALVSLFFWICTLNNMLYFVERKFLDVKADLRYLEDITFPTKFYQLPLFLRYQWHFRKYFLTIIVWWLTPHLNSIVGTKVLRTRCSKAFPEWVKFILPFKPHFFSYINYICCKTKAGFPCGYKLIGPTS